MNRRSLGEEQIRTIQRQIAVDLIRRNLMVARDAIMATGIHQRLRTQNIGLEENAWILNRAIHMAFRCKVYNNIRLFFFEERKYRFPVADIRLYKPEIRIIHHGLQRGQVASVGQLIILRQSLQFLHLGVRIRCSAGNNQFFSVFTCLKA